MRIAGLVRAAASPVSAVAGTQSRRCLTAAIMLPILSTECSPTTGRPSSGPMADAMRGCYFATLEHEFPGRRRLKTLAAARLATSMSSEISGTKGAATP